MTSQTIAAAIPIAAKYALSPTPSLTASGSERSWQTYWPDSIAILFTVVGVLLSFTKFRLKNEARTVYLLSCVGLLGFVCGHLLSQASIIGWSAYSIPWNSAPGLVLLCLTAFVIPVFSKHQTYCQHVCPFGAIQQLTRRKMTFRIRINKSVRGILQFIPVLLLAVSIFVGFRLIEFNLASVEPFDAFQIRVAGWVSISIFLFGLIASTTVPMAYCRYGCPTGALLKFLKFRSDSHQLGLRDCVATVLLLIAVSLFLS